MKRCTVSAAISAVVTAVITHLKNADLIIKPSDNLHKYLGHTLEI